VPRLRLRPSGKSREVIVKPEYLEALDHPEPSLRDVVFLMKCKDKVNTKRK